MNPEHPLSEYRAALAHDCTGAECTHWAHQLDHLATDTPIPIPPCGALDPVPMPVVRTLTAYEAHLYELATAEAAALRTKLTEYGLTTDNPFELLDRAARKAGVTREQLWLAWTVRHAEALHADLPRDVLRRRLLDLYGYCCQGLAMLREDLPVMK
jgi:hypothetical protein